MKFVIDMLIKEQATYDNDIMNMQSQMDEINAKIAAAAAKSQELGRAIQAVKMAR